MTNNFEQLMITGLREILGDDAFSRVSSLPGGQPSESAATAISMILAGLSHHYGEAGKRGIVLQAGRSAFLSFLRLQGDSTGFFEPAYRLLPSSQRIYNGLEKLTQQLQHDYHLHSQASQNDQAWLWQIDNCPECSGQQTTAPTCHFFFGWLAEYIAWASGDKFFPVQETTCAATGAKNCTFQIGKRPLE